MFPGDTTRRVENAYRLHVILMELVDYVDASDAWALKRYAQASDSVFMLYYGWGETSRDATAKVADCLRHSCLHEHPAAYLRLVTTLKPEQSDRILKHYLHCRTTEQRIRAETIVEAGLATRAIALADQLPYRSPTADIVRRISGSSRGVWQTLMGLLYWPRLD